MIETLRYFLILALLLFSTGCRTSPKKTPAHQPYENLLTIAADCLHYLREDVYRFGYPRDASGRNAYKSFAIRFANYEKLYPDRYPEIVSFMRGRIWEKLGDYNQAAHYYNICAAMKGELSEAAEARWETALKFDRICGRNIRGTDAETYIEDSEARVAELALLIADSAGTDTCDLARLEKEKADVDLALFMQNNRHIIKDGVNRAIQKWKDIIEEHAESSRIQSHRIHLGDLYFALAREYASWKPPERIGFEWDMFEGFVMESQRYYYRASLEDGYPEKPEARAKLEALLSYMEDIRRKSR
ncbi:hypothetical protein JW926_11175 [Candidatus Sumerlaeota bacterium]|nr:hypothetical protein [Candidatus Sumerlaeota bacterium]